LADNGYAILEQLKSFPSNDSEIKEFWTDVRGVTKERKNTEKPQHPVLQLSMHRKIFSECWLAYLKLPMTLDLYKRILLIMHKRILPFMVHPTLLMDFLTDSYNSGKSLTCIQTMYTYVIRWCYESFSIERSFYTDPQAQFVSYKVRYT
jgi:U3 small nucleolar RNA-associated protein 19